MFDPQTPYNDLPPISTLEIDTSLLAKLAEDARVAIEILNYADHSTRARKFFFNHITPSFVLMLSRKKQEVKK